MVCVQLCVRCKALKSFRRFILRRRRIAFVHPIVRSLLSPFSVRERAEGRSIHRGSGDVGGRLGDCGDGSRR